ncbi:MAG: tetratricopeptide repeat protein [Candidatus Sericytochromatia bacterium]
MTKTWDRDTQINYMKKAVDLAPQNDLAYMLLGNWYFKYKNDHENAIKNLEKALEIDPNTPFTLFQLGIIYLTKKNDLKAVDYLKKSCDKGMKGACAILKEKNY